MFFTKDGEYKGFVEVGYLPDNIKFTLDGKNLIVANEGEPVVLEDGISIVDPEGSVSLIDVRSGVDYVDKFTVNDITFDGVYIDENVLIEKVTDGSEAKHDFEPEYIAVDEANKYAYIALQENNAIVKLDVNNKKIIRVYGLGFKDYSMSGLDSSDKDGGINVNPWPVLGMYQPDGMDILKIGNKEYIFTSNEGDGREYGNYKNEVRVGKLDKDIKLNAKYYKGYSQSELDEIVKTIKDDKNLGRLNVNPNFGKNDNDEYEALYGFGARSFSIWDSENMSLVYDSGDDFEQITADRLPDYFNTTNDKIIKDDRSDNKGPEPEDIKVGKVGDKYYAFIGLERISGIMVYDVTNPEEPEFLQYITTRDYNQNVAGDCAPEGLEFIEAKNSPTGTPLLLVANEVSGTLAVFEVEGEKVKVEDNIKIAVISDPHYYAEELGTTGAAFEDYLSKDRKLIKESSYILKSAVDEIKKSDVDIVLVSGDLTKDGERISHEQFAMYLKELKDSGKQVYVVAGNHDINNPMAVKFEGDKVTRVSTVTPEEFKKIYNNFGYSEAIDKDPNSLSYVAEPVEGLTIIGMDSCLYDTNIEDNYPKTEGSLSPNRLNWIKQKIKEGKTKGNTVIGLMHHGLVEHFEYQEELFSQYVIKDWDKISKELADIGLDAVFTGHFHAQDIVKTVGNSGNVLYYIETGSLVTYPSAYRLSNLTKDGELKIETKHVTNIDYNIGGKSFHEYAKTFLIEGLYGLVDNEVSKMMIPSVLPVIERQLKEKGLTEEQIKEQAPILSKENIIQQLNTPIIDGTNITIKKLSVEALLAHYQGDEKADGQTLQILQNLTKSEDETTKMLGEALLSIWNDPEPSDNNVILMLNKKEENESSSDGGSSSSGSSKSSSKTNDKKVENKEIDY